MPKKKHPWGVFTDRQQADQHILSRYVIYTPPGGTPRIVSIGRIVNPDNEHKVARVQFNRHDGGYGQMPEFYDIDDPGFNSFRFDPLGWLNHDMGAVLAELVPIRQTRRGYGNENVELWWFGKVIGLEQPDRDELHLDTVLKSDGFNEMLRDEYPSLNEALPAVFGNAGMSIATSRKLVVQVDVDGYTWLWRGCEKVAMFSDRETCNLGNRYEYLREELLDTLQYNDGVWLK